MLGVSTESGIAGFVLMIELIVVWEVCPFLQLTRCSIKAIYVSLSVCYLFYELIDEKAKTCNCRFSA